MGRRTICTASLLALCACTVAQAQSNLYIDIPAEPLAAALRQFADEAHLELAVEAALTAGRTAPAVKGQFTPEEALRRLLQGSHLTYKFLGNHIVAISAAAPEKPKPTAAIAPSGYAAQDTPAPQSQDDADQPTRAVAAQTVAVQARDLEEVIVTGSHIAGGPPPGSPMLTVTSEDIEHSGYSSINEVIRSLPQSFGGGVNFGSNGVTEVSITQNYTGASTVNLRGLGSDSTLTLVDGHRLAYDGTSSAFDISVLPLAAIDRVEILTDSASAIYGSDAVAGVANFILKQNFQGAETSVRYGVATRGGDSEREVEQLLGTAWGGGNALLSYEHDGSNDLTGSERSFSTDSGPQTLIPAQKKDSVFVTIHQNLGADISSHVEGLYSDRRNADSINYYGASIADNPLFNVDTTNRLFSVAGGLSAHLGLGWNVSLEGETSASTNDYLGTFTQGGAVLESADYMWSNRSTSVELAASGPLVRTWAGPVQGAFGAGYLRQTFDDTSNELGRRHIEYTYGELRLPLVQSDPERTGLTKLELSLAGRYEDYSDFGSSKTPKLGLTYAPTADLALRGSWGKAFRAPDLQEEYGIRDLTVYPASLLSATQPATAQVLLQSGSNPSLQPETARTWTTGLDLTPQALPGLKIAATYFDIDYRNRIASPVANLLESLSNPAYAPFIVTHPSAALQAALFSQANLVENYAGTYTPGAVTVLIEDQFQNISAQRTHGVDLTSNYHLQSRIGDWDFSLNNAWLTLTQQFSPNSASLRLTGTVFNPPNYRSRLGVSWKYSAWSVSGFINYVGHELDNASLSSYEVASWTTVDTQVSYDTTSLGPWFKGLHANVAVQNLLDRDPPYVNGLSTYLPSVGYDGSNASPVGRMVSLSLRKEW